MFVDTIISKSAYLWNLMKLFYIEIYDLLCAKVELISLHHEKFSVSARLTKSDSEILNSSSRIFII